MPADAMEPLAYQNRFVRQLVQTMNDYEASDATPQVISGPDNMIILQVSLEEWIKLTSSVFTGADICYPDESDSVRWILFRAVEQPVDLCALIAECIATSEATQAAIRDFVTSDPEINQHINNIVDSGKPLGPEIEAEILVENDDLDALFGSITFLVDTIHDAIVDFNEDAEAANNSRELGQILFAAIPVIETLPFNEMSQYADTLFEQIIEVFNSQWDTTPITGTRDRIRCALFCAARDNGNALTWEMVSQYFFERTSFTWGGTLNIMLEFANFVATGTWTGEEVVDIAFGNFAAAMSGMGKFGEMIFPSMAALMALGQDTPDPDWEIVCEECPPPPPEGCTDFTADEGLWHIYADTGDYVASEGYQGDYFAGFDETVLYVERSATTGLGTATGYTFTLNASVNVSTAHLFVNDVASGSRFGLTGVSEIVFDSSTIGGWTDKDANYKIRLQLTTSGDNSWRLIEACVLIAP